MDLIASSRQLNLVSSTKLTTKVLNLEAHVIERLPPIVSGATCTRRHACCYPKNVSFFSLFFKGVKYNQTHKLEEFAFVESLALTRISRYNSSIK